MKIGELARQADVTTKAVRYYESLGLITPERLANGYRNYGVDDVRLVREIRTLHQLGIPVERTRPFLECLAAGRLHADDCPASLASYRDSINELTERIEALTARRATLIDNLNAAAHRGSTVVPTAETGTGAEDYTTLPADLPRPVDDSAASHLPGLKAPRITLLNAAGKEIELNALGPRRTVIYIYPLTGRPGIDLPEGWNSIPGARGCTPNRAASGTTSKTSSKPAPAACTGCPARTPSTSTKSWNDSPSPSTCSPTQPSAWPTLSAFPPSRSTGQDCSSG